MKLELLLIAITAIAMTVSGCQGVVDQSKENVSTPTGTEVSVEDEHQYVPQGTVIQIEGNKVHVLSGDIAEVFEVTKESIDKIYLGENVKILEDDKGNKVVVASLIEDFSIRHTSMGQLIETKVATVKAVETVEEVATVSLVTEAEALKATYHNETELEIGKEYTFEITSFSPEELFIMNVYDESATIAGFVEKISRLENGEMLLLVVDDESNQYELTTANAVVNFNLSEIKNGDSVKFYYTEILESSPAKVTSNKILKMNE